MSFVVCRSDEPFDYAQDRQDRRSVIRHGLVSWYCEAVRLRFATLTYEDLFFCL